MGDVIEIKGQPKWCVGYAYCVTCTNAWIAVYPEDTNEDSLECPCGKTTGKVFDEETWNRLRKAL